MKVLTSSQIREIDKYTINNEPIDSIDLMERAALQCFEWIKENFGECLSIKVFAGPGNNGGDGLAIARMLAESDSEVEIYLLTPPERLSPDALVNYKRISRNGRIRIYILEESNNLPEIYETDIVIDALFGTGISRPLSGLAIRIVQHINQSSAKVIAIDLPSGLFSEATDVENIENIVEAEYTLTFQVPKPALFFAENEKFLGNWVLLDIGLMPEAIDSMQSYYFMTEKPDIELLLKRRKRFSHKGTYGHALLIAGSYGKMGAAVLAAKSCLRTGVGLLTAHVIQKGCDIMQISVPEAMVSVDSGPASIAGVPNITPYSAIGIGPGIGTDKITCAMVENIVNAAKQPLVLDADALNILALNPNLINLLPENTILTPHPGEFDRIAGSSKNGYERHLKQIELSEKNKIIIVLKGAFTSVTSPDGLCYFNSTGNPGMATAGSGDVLTGMILSLLAQSYQPLQAAIIGVYLHGLAGDLASAQLGEEAMLSSDMINYIGKAFAQIKIL